MEEQILNYLDMSEEQKEKSLRDLKSIGFYPAYGKENLPLQLPLPQELSPHLLSMFLYPS